jgi:glycosyltransferase involved in cell wall biosynthesis
MQPLTAIIPTFNEEVHIEAVIDSVSFADEVLVVDSFSTDRTVELARNKGARIIQRAYNNSASQKNWAIPQAKHEWILLVDADERITPKLQEEIHVILSGQPEHVAYWIYRTTEFMGRKVRYSGWQGDKVIRLFLRDKCRYEEKHVHAEIEADGSVGFLKNRMYHLTYKGLNHWLSKADWYSTWGAYDRLDRVNKVGSFQLLVKPAFTFFNKYFLRLGFLDGKVGFILAAQYSWYVFLRAVKIWRLQQGEKLPRKKE